MTPIARALPRVKPSQVIRTLYRPFSLAQQAAQNTDPAQPWLPRSWSSKTPETSRGGSPALRTGVIQTLSAFRYLDKRGVGDGQEGSPVGILAPGLLAALPRMSEKAGCRALCTQILGPVLPHLVASSTCQADENRRITIAADVAARRIAPRLYALAGPEGEILAEGLRTFPTLEERFSGYDLYKALEVVGESAGLHCAKLVVTMSFPRAFEEVHSAEAIVADLVRCAWLATWELQSRTPWYDLRNALLRMACLDDRCHAHPDCLAHPELARDCFEATVRPWLEASS